jgi:two-component system, OmpR family, heavy metal sensor histidine kinase CusS
MLMHSLSVRARLTALYLLVTFVGLLLFGVLSYAALRYALFEGKRTHLQGREERLLHFIAEVTEQGAQWPLTEPLRNYALVTHEGNLFAIHDLDGSLLFPATVQAEDWVSLAPKNCDRTVFSFQMLDHEPALIMCHRVAMDGRWVRIYLGGSLEEEFFILTRYRNALLLLMPGLLMLSAAAGYFLSRHALKPVDRMTQIAMGIGIDNLSARLPVPSARDEIQYLAVAWNHLLGRVEAAVSRLSQFSADVSHDLRTSITVILATAQLSLTRYRSEEEYRHDFSRVVAECMTASTLLDALLSMARSDTFMQEAAFKRIDLCELVVNGCRRLEDLAESRGLMLDWYLPGRPVYIDGDELLLQRLLGILLDNAIKFTPEEGEIRAEVSLTEEGVMVVVKDTGIGMSEDVCNQIFRRFYQADLRERKTQAGSGLGLAIARWIADAHRAELTVKSTPLKGSAFQIRFPIAISGSPAEHREQYIGR